MSSRKQVVLTLGLHRTTWYWRVYDVYHSPPIHCPFLSLHSPLSYLILDVAADFEFLGVTLISILYLLSFHILLH